jgi:eukaryotic-like serine/threonine-protein kinase
MSEQAREAANLAQDLCRRYEVACRQALQSGSQLPALDSFLGDVAAELLPEIRRALARIADTYHQQHSNTPLPADRLRDPPPAAGAAPPVSASGTENQVGDATVGAPAAIRLPDPEAPTLSEERPQSVRLPQVPGYDILDILGRGGMGVVYKARQRGLNRLVALKMILAGDFASESDLARFRAEAEAVAQFQHANIVHIYDIGEHEGRPFFSLELVDGDSLSKKVAAGPLAPRLAATIVRDMALAMQYAHDKGIIHRDLKPANVLLSAEGQPKITDFGLAKRLDGNDSQTQTGNILGTPSYMPPEQAEGLVGQLGPRSDLYSLGAILYELLTGRAPFRAASISETLNQVRQREPVAPTQLQPGTPRDLETICLKCLQKDALKRYASAGDLAEDLRRFLAGEPIRARPVPAWERGWRWCRRNPAVASLSAAVLVLTLTALVGSILFSVVLYNEKTATEQETIRANANAVTAGEKAELASQSEQRAVANLDLAKKNEGQAIANLDLALKNEQRALASAKLADKRGDEALRKQYLAIKQMSNLASQTQKALLHAADDEQIEPILRPLREDLLKAVRANVLQLAKEMGQTGLTSSHIIQSHQALGDMFRNLGLPEQALEQFRHAYKLANDLAAQRKDDDRHRNNLGVMLLRLGDMERLLTADLPAATKYYAQALALQQDVEAHPYNNFYSPIDSKRLKSFSLQDLGEMALRQGHPAEARKYFEEAVGYRKEWVKADGKNALPRNYLAQAAMFLGEVSWHLEDQEAMHAAYAEAVGLMQQLVKQVPGSLDYKADLAETLLRYSDACLRLGKVQDAKKHCDASAEPLSAALRKDPENVHFLELTVRKEYRQGLIADQLEDPAAAEHFQAALKTCRRLVAIDAVNMPYQSLWALCLARGGKGADAVKIADALRPRVAKDPELLVQLAGCYALVADGMADDAAKKSCRDKALDILRAMIAAGYHDRVNLATHPDLTPLVRDGSLQPILAVKQ